MDENNKLVASALDKTMICQHLRLDSEYVDETEWTYIQALQGAAMAYICDHCAITLDKVDESEDLAIATLMLISDMYDERGRYVDSAHPNRTVECILSHHDENFIGTLDGDDYAVG